MDLRAAKDNETAYAATIVAAPGGGSSARVLLVDDAFGVLAALEPPCAPDWTLDELLGAIATDGAEVAKLRRLVADGTPTDVRIEPGRCGPQALLARLAPVDLNADGRPSHVVCTLAPDP